MDQPNSRKPLVLPVASTALAIRLPARPNLVRDDAVAAATGFPIRLLTIACFLTMTAFAWFGWNVFDARRDVNIFTGRLSRVEELRGIIVHLDEVLTMSARMAVATGDLQWEKRYRKYAQQLDAAIKESIKLASTLSALKSTAETDEANHRLVEMENRAFAFIRTGHREEAQAVLSSFEYDTQKKIYAVGITSFVDKIRREIDEDLRESQRMDLFSMTAALIVAGTSVAALWSAARSARRWRAQLLDSLRRRAEAEQNLHKAHRKLEVRVAARTADLVKTNERLQTEITDRRCVEKALRQSEEHMRLQTAALEAAANGVAITDCKGTIRWVNRAFMELTGYSAEEELARIRACLDPGGIPSPFTKRCGKRYPKDRFGKASS